MVSRRDLIVRAVSLAGLCAVRQKLPRGLALLAPGEGEAAEASRLARTAVDVRDFGALPDPAAFLLIKGCKFVKGDPMLNDPDWVEDAGGGVLIQNRLVHLPGLLTLPAVASVVILDSAFRDVTLAWETDEEAIGAGSAFVSFSGTTFVNAGFAPAIRGRVPSIGHR